MKWFACVALFMLMLFNVEAWDREYREGFELLKTIESSDLIVVGEVTEKEGVFRKEIERGITTDITVEVETLIKGTPNSGKTTVKFMMHGGTATNPDTNEESTLYIPDLPTFKVGERMLLFLLKSEDPYHKNYAYEQYQPYRVAYGKRQIKDGKINIAYLNKKDRFTYVEFPIELVMKFTKAFERDEDATKLVENTIREMVKKETISKISLNEVITTKLKRRTSRIIKTERGK